MSRTDRADDDRSGSLRVLARDIARRRDRGDRAALDPRPDGRPRRAPVSSMPAAATARWSAPRHRAARRRPASIPIRRCLPPPARAPTRLGSRRHFSKDASNGFPFPMPPSMWWPRSPFSASSRTRPAPCARWRVCFGRVGALCSANSGDGAFGRRSAGVRGWLGSATWKAARFRTAHGTARARRAGGAFRHRDPRRRVLSAGRPARAGRGAARFLARSVSRPSAPRSSR